MLLPKRLDYRYTSESNRLQFLFSNGSSYLDFLTFNLYIIFEIKRKSSVLFYVRRSPTDGDFLFQSNES